MSEALKKMDEAFEALIGIEADMEEFMQSEDAGIAMKAGGKATIRDGVIALRNLVSRLAGALAEKSIKTEAEETIAKAIEKMPDAAQLQLPEGSIVVHGDEPQELSILVLRKVSADHLERLVKGAGKSLAGGSNDALAIVERVAPAKQLHHWDNRPYGFEGFPEIGTVIVKSADEAGLLTKATGPTEPKGDLADVGDYLLKAAQKGANVQVRLVDEGDAKPAEEKKD